MPRRRTSKTQELTGTVLKEALWDTLQKVKDKSISPKEANSIASQSREICRVAKLQLEVIKLTNKKPTAAQKNGLLL